MEGQRREAERDGSGRVSVWRRRCTRSIADAYSVPVCASLLSPCALSGLRSLSPPHRRSFLSPDCPTHCSLHAHPPFPTSPPQHPPISDCPTRTHSLLLTRTPRRTLPFTPTLSSPRSQQSPIPDCPRGDGHARECRLRHPGAQPAEAVHGRAGAAAGVVQQGDQGLGEWVVVVVVV